MSATAVPVALAPHEVVWQLSEAVVPSTALQAVAELGVADQLDDRGATAADLASRCGLDAAALDRVLRLLCAHGIFEWNGTAYHHTPASELLQTDHPQSMRAFARLNALPVAARSIAALSTALRTGNPGVETVEPAGFYAYLTAHADEGAVFADAMSQKARADIADLLAAYDVTPFKTVADVAGGHGHLLEAIVASSDRINGVLFELPDVAATVTASERIRVQSGDFFCDALPAADLYVLMEIIHDWSDREAAAILGAVRRAADPGATILIVEHIPPDDGVDIVSQTLDVLMLAVTGGRERTPAELNALLRNAGFEPSRVVRTAGPISAVEAVAV